MKIRLLRAIKTRELMQQIRLNLDRYRDGDFDPLEYDPSSYIEIEHEIDKQVLSTVDCTADNHEEVQNCEKLHIAMNGLSLYLARDERIWVYLAHTTLLDYTRKRWPIPKDDADAVQHIRTHFFVVGNRGFERDNSASRLWWMASLCNRAIGINMHDALTCLLYQYDVRANIIERPTTSQNVQIFSSILRKLHTSYSGDKALFVREKFREAMKALNLKGGTTLLDALDELQLDHVVGKCLS